MSEEEEELFPLKSINVPFYGPLPIHCVYYTLGSLWAVMLLIQCIMLSRQTKLEEKQKQGEKKQT
eukprot:9475063-Pyramimonas_sp.AAC.1